MRRPLTQEKLDRLPPLPRDGMTAAEFAAGAPEPRERSKHLRPSSPRERARFATEVANFLRSQDWATATPGHLVALYAWCHAQTYRVEPAELEDGREHALACVHVRRFVDQQFGGKVEPAVDFLKWAWRREGERERWRVENGKAGGRIGWRLQFSPSLMTDYKIALAREAKR